MLNSRRHPFTATSKCSGSKSLHKSWHAFSLSYGINLQSSLARDHSSALGFSPHPPVSDYGTVILATSDEVFLGSMGSTTIVTPEGDRSYSLLGVMTSRIYLGHPPTGLNGHFQSAACLPFSVTSKVIALPKRYRNINLSSITYAFRPRLRYRLTLSGLTLLRKPWIFGDVVSHYVYRYSCQHKLFRYLQTSFQSSFNGLRNTPLPRII